MARHKSPKCIDFSDWVAPGENPNGMVNVSAAGIQHGTEPRDLLGRQEWGGESLVGGESGAFGPDWGLSDKEKAAMYGPMPAMRAVPAPGKRRK